MDWLASVEATYFKTGAGRYFAKIECQSCNVEGVKNQKILPIFVPCVECGCDIEHHSSYTTSTCLTLRGCEYVVKKIMARTKNYLLSCKCEEICAETIII